MKKRNKAEVLSGQRIKIAALLTGISLLLLSGCGNKAQEVEGSQVQTDIAVTATEQTAAAEEQAETTDPETLDYAYRLHITINPEFKLYLDKQSKVVAVACLNQDAEDLFSETDLTGMDLEKAMPVIIQQAVAKEYLADGKNITIDLEKSTESGQADTVEQVIAAAVTAELKEQGVDAVLELQDAGTPVTIEESDTGAGNTVPDKTDKTGNTGNSENTDNSDKAGNVAESGANNAAPGNGTTGNGSATNVSQKTKCSACDGTGICQECKGGTAPCKRCGGSLWETCGTCGGSGRQTCPGCGGSGVDATSGTSCRHCGGSGGNTCQQCGGSGGKSCSICHGKGVISDDCILCHGDKKCTVCGGSGEL